MQHPHPIFLHHFSGPSQAREGLSPCQQASCLAFSLSEEVGSPFFANLYLIFPLLVAGFWTPSAQSTLGTGFYHYVLQGTYSVAPTSFMGQILQLSLGGTGSVSCRVLTSVLSADTYHLLFAV